MPSPYIGWFWLVFMGILILWCIIIPTSLGSFPSCFSLFSDDQPGTNDVTRMIWETARCANPTESDMAARFWEISHESWAGFFLPTTSIHVNFLCAWNPQTQKDPNKKNIDLLVIKPRDSQLLSSLVIKRIWYRKNPSSLSRRHRLNEKPIGGLHQRPYPRFQLRAEWWIFLGGKSSAV